MSQANLIARRAHQELSLRMESVAWSAPQIRLRPAAELVSAILVEQGLKQLSTKHCVHFANRENSPLMIANVKGAQTAKSQLLQVPFLAFLARVVIEQTQQELSAFHANPASTQMEILQEGVMIALLLRYQVKDLVSACRVG